MKSCQISRRWGRKKWSQWGPILVSLQSITNFKIYIWIIYRPRTYSSSHFHIRVTLVCGICFQQFFDTIYTLNHIGKLLFFVIFYSKLSQQSCSSAHLEWLAQPAGRGGLFAMSESGSLQMWMGAYAAVGPSTDKQLTLITCHVVEIHWEPTKSLSKMSATKCLSLLSNTANDEEKWTVFNPYLASTGLWWAFRVNNMANTCIKDICYKAIFPCKWKERMKKA